MAPIVSYILMSILVAPALVNMGVPVIAAHFFILYMSVSGFITPPVCLAAYIAGGMVGKSGVSVGFKAMRFGIVCYLVPFVCLFAPELLLVGTTVQIIESTITAVFGVVMLAAGLEGYLVGDTKVAERVLYLIAGITLFYPGAVTDIIGAVAGVVAVVLQLMSRKHSTNIQKA